MDEEEFVRSLMANRKLKKLAQLWAAGIEIDWELLYTSGRPRRISLPTYPFERKRYWRPETEKGQFREVAGLHPLIDNLDPKLSLNLSGIAKAFICKQ